MAAEGLQTTRENHSQAVEMALEMGDDPAVRPDIVQAGLGHNYGTHYLNAGFVIGYLFRVEPFLRLHVVLHDGKFDKPDRMFNSIGHSWRSASQGQPQEQRELVPEFYYDHSFLQHRSGIDFGIREHTKTPVGDVRLPPWARGSAPRFVRIMRQAMESDHVSANLHKWIDLVFGVHQRPTFLPGSPKESLAEEKMNVYHSLFYENSMDEERLSRHPEGRQALIMARIYRYELGQTPRQLFVRTHPVRWLGAPMTLPSVPMLSRSVFGAATSTCSIVAGMDVSTRHFDQERHRERDGVTQLRSSRDWGPRSESAGHEATQEDSRKPGGQDDNSGISADLALQRRRRLLRQHGIRGVMPWVPYDRPEFGFSELMNTARDTVYQRIHLVLTDLRKLETESRAATQFNTAGSSDGDDTYSHGSGGPVSETEQAMLARRLGLHVHQQRIIGLFHVEAERPRLITVDATRAVGLHCWTTTAGGVSVVAGTGREKRSNRPG